MHTSTIQHVSFFVLVALVTLLFFGMIYEFIQPLFWAAVLAILFNRLQKLLSRLFRGHASIAAAFSVLVIVVIVILPLLFVIAAVTREAIALFERIAEGESEFQEVVHYIGQALPAVEGYLERFGFDFAEIEQRLASMAVAASRFLGTQIVSVGQGTAELLLKFFLMLYILFFFLRDGDRLLAALGRALPFDDLRERRLFAKFAEVSRATMKGTLIVGAIQGTIGGGFFWILGISAPVFWGVVMTILALLPALGTPLVWGPAAVILMFTGEPVKGLILLIAGILIISLVDNLLRPILVGRDTQMPDFLVLLSTLGGLLVFGISGFVLGPIVAALFLTIWDMFAREYSQQIERARKPPLNSL
ncbi:MAG: AI-2E family transporter [Desulfobacterales bacterium]